MKAVGTIDVSAWERAADETRGRRAKVWLRAPDGALWLRKSPLEWRAFESAIEALTLRIAAEAGLLDVPESELAVWTDPAGDAHQGIVVRSFLGDDEELSLGDQVIAADDSGFDPESHEAHTPARALAALRRLGGRSPENLVDRFMDILVFDAWLGLGDRHSQNWGVIRDSTGAVRLAPIFDVAACLGSELHDDHVLLRSTGVDRTTRLERYRDGCPSGFGDGSQMVSQRDLVEACKGEPAWRRRAAELLPGFEGLLPTVRGYVYTLSEAILPPARRELAADLLEVRLEWLKGFVNAP